VEEYIKLLDLPDEFDFAILKKAYRKKVMKFHPDKAKDEAQRVEFEAIMKRLNEANDYLKEYLESHDGKYTKPIDEDIKEDCEEETEDYSNSQGYDENNSDEEQHEDSINEEEEYEEVNEDEYEETNDENSETFSEDKIKDLSLFERVIYIVKMMFSAETFHEVLNNPNANPFTPVFGSLKNMLLFIVLFSLLLYPIYNFIDKHVYPDNNQPKQEKVQDSTTDQKNSNTATNKPLTPENTAEINEYMGNVQQKIKRNWDLPKNTMTEQGYNEVKVVVELTISKDGRLLGEPLIKESSGLAIVDSRCIEAVKLSSPFNPLPDFMSDDSYKMEFTFEANRD
jgi:hypothetical protein